MKKLLLLSLCFAFIQAGEQVICKNRNYDYLFRDDLYFKISYDLSYYYGSDTEQIRLEEDYEEPPIVEELIYSKLPSLANDALKEAQDKLLENGDCKKVIFDKEKK